MTGDKDTDNSSLLKNNSDMLAEEVFKSITKGTCGLKLTGVFSVIIFLPRLEEPSEI